MTQRQVLVFWALTMGDCMNLVLGICAAVAALVSLGLFWWRSRVGKEIALMASVDTSGAGSVASSRTEVPYLI